MHRLRSRVPAAFVALLACAPLAWTAPHPQAAALHPPEASAKGEALLTRIAVLGASVSSGYGLAPDPAGGRIDLARVIDSSLAIPHEPILDASSAMTFGDPVGAAQRAFRKLEEKPPTLVVALDYLFWFGYGSSWGGEAERLAALERGLAPLAKLECPILLGDFPDMSSALQAKMPLLPPQAVPAPEVLQKLNARLAEWAKQHPNVIVVPVSKLMIALRTGEDLHVGANLWPKGRVQSLLQDDGLHTTLEGTTGVWLFAVERLRDAHKDLPRAAIEARAAEIVHKIVPDLKVEVVADPVAAKAKAAGNTKGAKGTKEH